MGRWTALTLALAFGVVLAAVALWPRSYEPDMSAIEDDLATEVGGPLSGNVSVRCPESVDWQPGTSFRCLVVDGRAAGFSSRRPTDTYRSALRLEVTVNMQNNDGDYSFGDVAPE